MMISKIVTEHVSLFVQNQLKHKRCSLNMLDYNDHHFDQTCGVLVSSSLLYHI